MHLTLNKVAEYLVSAEQSKSFNEALTKIGTTTQCHAVALPITTLGEIYNTKPFRADLIVPLGPIHLEHNTESLVKPGGILYLTSTMPPAPECYSTFVRPYVVSSPIRHFLRSYQGSGKDPTRFNMD